jgi:hypothetical protein
MVDIHMRRRNEFVDNLFGSVEGNHTKNKRKRNSNHSGDSNGNLFFVGHFVGISEQGRKNLMLVGCSGEKYFGQLAKHHILKAYSRNKEILWLIVPSKFLLFSITFAEHIDLGLRRSNTTECVSGRKLWGKGGR